MIEHEQYVEAKVNQYYFEDRPEYHMEHHLHQMLFYGFDDTKKEFLLIGYRDNGLLKKMTLKYSFAKRKDCIKEIYSVEYKPDGNPFPFNTNYVLEMIRQYLKSENSSFYLNFIVASPTRKYGIKTYDDLTSKEGLTLLVSDKRILHLICEHKICMKKRIDYLIYKKVIPGESVKEIAEKTKEIVDETENFKYLVIKCSLSMNPFLLTKIKEKLLEIKEKEIVCLTKLLKICSNPTSVLK